MSTYDTYTPNIIAAQLKLQRLEDELKKNLGKGNPSHRIIHKGL